MIPVGYVRSPYREKFAVPRQPGLASRVVSEVVMEPAYSDPEAFRGIEQYSHLWLVFDFNLIREDPCFRPLVRPPRLGGNTRLGVFASRSPYRPNRIGLSAVRFIEVVRRGGRTKLVFSGGDLVDGTPVYDIKPYIAFSDSIPDSVCGIAAVPPARRRVEFSSEALLFIKSLESDRYPELQTIISDILSYDHRPAYRGVRGGDPNVYGVALYDFNVRFMYLDDVTLVMGLEPLGSYRDR
jgi:tRNA-Thr(GGU) m(6)t(6)A37 methyltransferase TsaA